MQKSSFPASGSGNLLLIGAITLLAAMNAATLLKPYSFWLDELATVSLFNASGGSLLSYLMQDNFPPLYFLIIKAWGLFFGISEISLRFFSFLCTFAALAVVGYFVRSYERGGWIWSVFAVFLFGTLPTVAYYAQESRPYALLLLLSSLTITSALAVVKANSDRHPPYTESCFYVFALLLSLTHYFGLFLVFLIGLANLVFLNRAQKLRNLVLFGVCLVWPSLHFSHSSVLAQTGGNFWIQVSPVFGTLKVLFVTTPFLVLFLPLAVPCLLLALRGQFSLVETPLLRSVSYLLFLFSSFVGVMIFVDIHTPLSLPRYFITIVPVATLAVVELVQVVFASLRWPQFKIGFALVAILVLAAQLVKAEQRIELKSAPEQDWKTLAAVVRQSSLCSMGCDALGYSKWGDYYFSGLSIRNLDPGASAQWNHFKIQRPLLGFHRAAALIPSLAKANPGVVCLEPKQSIPGSAFLMADPSRLSAALRQQLLPCSLAPSQP
jgi:uncharacterized membrane protein